MKLRPDEGGAGKICLAPTRRFLHELSFYISIIAEKGRAVKRKKCGKKRNFREFWHFSAAFSARFDRMRQNVPSIDGSLRV